MALVLTGDGQITADNFTVAANGNTTSSGAITSTGLITASGGVAIGGTGTANTLDDFEEGTFTPFLNSLTQNPTYSQQTGRYVKVGRICHTYIKIHTTSFNNGTGNLQVGGLPFTQTGVSGTYTVGSFFGIFGWEDYDNIVPQIVTGANTMDLYQFVKWAGSNYVTINNTHLHGNGTGQAFMFTVGISYEVA